MTSTYQVDLTELMKVVDDVRHDRRMTWAEVAEELGITRQYMSRLKTGKTDQPPIRVYVSILNWLNLTDIETGRLVKRLTVIKENS